MADELNAEENENLVEKIAEEFLSRLRKNENLSTEELAKQHPQLAPALERRLKLVESIYRATAFAKNEPLDIDSPIQSPKTAQGRSTIQAQTVDAVVRISCPHCGNKVQIVGIHANEVTCGSCGSSVKIVSSPTVSMSDGEVPKQLDRFIVKRVLGEGAFGIVFLARDPKLERDVAIKTPRSGFFATREEQRRFFREAKHAASLRHPNIVQVYEISESENAPLIVSEFIDGLTLNDLASGELLTFKDTARLMIQIANAVEFAHQKGVIHRDLKPSNILLDQDRNAYITDFGLARRDEAEITMTLDGAILGTPAYMAPEQAEGNQQLIGCRSDVYSLGVILYRLTTRDLPFHGTKRMLVHQVIHDDPKPPRSLNQFIPRDLETITLKAMSKSPNDRYQSAGKLAEELQRFLMGEPIHARPIGNVARLARWCGRHPAIAWLSGSIAALLILSATIATLWAVSADRLKQIADRNASEAVKNEQESLHRLHEMLMSNGVKELEQNNLTNSSLWFTEALVIEDRPNDRTRIAMIQDRVPTLLALWTTGSGLRSTAFSNDGSRVMAASEKSVSIFETLTKKKLFDELVTGYRRIRFSPDGTKFAICGQDKTAQLWNVDERRMIAKLQHDDQVESLDFDPESSKVVSGSFDSFAKVWNAHDGSLLATHSFDGSRVIRVTCIKDTNLVIVVTNREEEKTCELAIWDHVQDVVTAKGMMHGSFIVSVDVSADGKRFCSGERDGSIKVWEIPSGNQVGTSLVTTNRLYDAVFTSDATMVLGLFANGEISTLDYQTGAKTGLINSSQRKVDSLAQSPGNTILALAGKDGQVSFLWRKTGRQICTSINNGKSASSVAFHPDGDRIAVAGSEGVLQLWDLAGSSPNSFVLPHTGNVRNAIFASSTNRCLTTSLDGKGYIWNTTNGKRIGSELEHTNGIYECAVTSDGNLFVTSGADKTVKIWDSAAGKQFGKSLVHDANVWVVRFNRDGTRVFTGDEAGAVRCWEVSANTAIEPTPIFEVHHNARIVWLALGSDGSTLASTSLDGSIRFWDPATGLPKFTQLKHGDETVFCDFLPDGKRLVSGGADSSVYVWELATGETLQKLATESNTHSIQVLEDGKRLVATDMRGRTRVWRANAAGVFSFETDFLSVANDDTFFSAFDAKNAILASCGGSSGLNFDEPRTGAVALWNINDTRAISPPLQHHGLIRRVYFSDDAQRLLTASEDQTARLWQMNSTSLPVAELKRIARLYAQYVPGGGGALETMASEVQSKEFEELSVKYPSHFGVNEADRTVWEYEVKQNSSQQ